MKILFLSFYYEPDLCAGSFRNSPLVKEIAASISDEDEVIVITTQPNRYKSYKVEAPEYEDLGKIKVHRINISAHNSRMKDQARSFWHYYKKALIIAKSYNFDMVYASSSRLFTAYLGSKLAKKNKVPYYVDVRDIFVDTMDNILENKLVRFFVIPMLKYLEKVTFKRATHINLISEGFHGYFKKKFKNPSYSFYSHGIDDIFLEDASKKVEKQKSNDSYQIVYAGNIGTGQGLDKIIPEVAKKLEDKYRFDIYGDGGAKDKLLKKIDELSLKNVKIHNPISRQVLLDIYKQADFLFLHLNSFDAFEKVLPSKLFEYGAYSTPIIAGVDGYAKRFITENLENTLLFEPCNSEQLIQLLIDYDYELKERTTFKKKFKRDAINKEMSMSILKLVNS